MMVEKRELVFFRDELFNINGLLNWLVLKLLYIVRDLVYYIYI